MPKKIAYILTTWPCQTETFAAREISLLRRRGFSITVLAAVGATPCPPFLSRTTLSDFLYLTGKYPLAWFQLFILIVRLAGSHPLEALRLIKNLSTVARFISLLDQHNIHHLHAYFLSWPATMALAICSVSKRTFSISAHSRDLFVEAGALQTKVSGATFITTCSQHGLTFLKKQLPVDLHHKCCLHYHGLEKTSDHSRMRSKESMTPQLLAIARFVPKKGISVLLHAFKQVQQTIPNVQLTLLGDGPQRNSLRKLADQLNISAAINMPGHHPNDELDVFFQSASMLIVPSIQAGDSDRDGIPNVIFESFAAGLPVIATTTGGIPEAIAHRETGLLVTPDCPDDLAQKIIELLSDDALQRTLANHALKNLNDRFDLEKNIRPLIALFEEFVA